VHECACMTVCERKTHVCERETESRNTMRGVCGPRTLWQRFDSDMQRRPAWIRLVGLTYRKILLDLTIYQTRNGFENKRRVPSSILFEQCLVPQLVPCWFLQQHETASHKPVISNVGCRKPYILMRFLLNLNAMP